MCHTGICQDDSSCICRSNCWIIEEHLSCLTRPGTHKLFCFLLFFSLLLNRITFKKKNANLNFVFRGFRYLPPAANYLSIPGLLIAHYYHFNFKVICISINTVPQPTSFAYLIQHLEPTVPAITATGYMRAHPPHSVLTFTATCFLASAVTLDIIQ